MAHSHFTIVPERSCTLNHYETASSTEGGVHAKIFIDPPKRSEEFPLDIEPNTVYLTSTSCSKATPPFLSNCHLAVQMPIKTYFTLINYFAEHWANIELVLNDKVEQMRGKSTPVQIASNIDFEGPGGGITFHTWVGDIALDARKESRDNENRIFVHLKRNQKIVQVYPAVMIKLAETLPQLMSLAVFDKLI